MATGHVIAQRPHFLQSSASCVISTMFKPPVDSSSYFVLPNAALNTESDIQRVQRRQADEQLLLVIQVRISEDQGDGV
jgi:hypothetical protein